TSFALPPSKVATIYNPSERSDPSGGIAPEHEALFEKPVVLGVGRLSPQKNFEMMLRAFAEIAARREANLLILGTGPDREALEAQAIRLGISDRVFFLGFVENPLAYMKRARVFALSSRNEGFPMVLIEAMHSGVPIVSTNCRHGPDEMLDHGRFGRIVPSGDAAALAGAIEAELDTPYAPEANRAARAKWLKQFEPKVIAAQYVELVRSVIEESETGVR
ncbi:MAG: glycosyltransferase, partial [Polyangiales bacterium]